MTGSFDVEALRAALVTPGGPWTDVEYHRAIGSTNARAAEVGEPGRVVVAEHQSRGRGRLSRTWEAPPDTSLALSATVPALRSGQGWLPLLAGLAMVEAIEATMPLRADLKWPNDVLLPVDASRKVCGILCEVVAGARGGVLGDGVVGGVVVVGAGINVSQRREQLPGPAATSLVLAGAGDVDRCGLAAAYLLGLAHWYRALASDIGVAGATSTSDATPTRRLEPAAAAGRAAYRARCVTIGRRVAVSRPGGADVLGETVEVDDDGRLVVDGPIGRRAWAAGDVVHVRAPSEGAPARPWLA